ncbi:MAG: GTP-binding protein [Nitrospirae bacterium]|nr:GTP-binding protein [Nitrospirota bacterium]
MTLVPVDIITGFLGSGKTTLIKHVLEKGLHGQRVAVIVNDLGDINVDGPVLRGMNVDKMVELSSGCICCSGLYRLGAGIQEIVESARPTLILIETSGAAAPAPVVAQLDELGYRTDAVTTVVDAETFFRMEKAEPVIAEQVAEADFLVMNKLDLVEAAILEKLRKTLSRLNPRAHRIETTFGAVASDLLFATGVRVFRERARLSPEGPDLHQDKIDSFVFETEERMNRDRLERCLAKLPDMIYLVKGFVRFSDETQPFLLNFTCGRYHLLPFIGTNDFHHTTQMVFVGRRTGECRQEILEALARCNAGEPSRSGSILGRLGFG